MSRTIILWAESITDPVGGGHPELMLGDPDGQYHALGPGMRATLTNFRGRFYSGLSTLLGKVTYGRPVEPGILATADVIVFEGNGGSPASSGGWESCDWNFSDGVNPPLSVAWDESTDIDATPVPHIVGNGSISGVAYSVFFGISVPVDPVISFLLFCIRPEIDTTSPSFKITVKGSSLPAVDATGLKVRELTPDIDAIGILAWSS